MEGSPEQIQQCGSPSLSNDVEDPVVESAQPSTQIASQQNVSGASHDSVASQRNVSSGFNVASESLPCKPVASQHNATSAVDEQNKLGALSVETDIDDLVNESGSSSDNSQRTPSEHSSKCKDLGGNCLLLSCKHYLETFYGRTIDIDQRRQDICNHTLQRICDDDGIYLEALLENVRQKYPGKVIRDNLTQRHLHISEICVAMSIWVRNQFMPSAF